MRDIRIHIHRDALIHAFVFYEMVLHLSLVVRKAAFCICQNKDADQL